PKRSPFAASPHPHDKSWSAYSDPPTAIPGQSQRGRLSELHGTESTETLQEQDIQTFKEISRMLDPLFRLL
ncbi:MAG: hypothetical protein ACRCU2_31185, partial [Planktothrix sp.]